MVKQLQEINSFDYKGITYPFSSKNIARAISDLDESLNEGLMTANAKISDQLILGNSYQEELIDGVKKSFSFKYIDKITKKRYSLKSETLMKKSKLPINYWVFAFHCIINNNDYSKRKIQLILGHNFYEPVSYMYDKIVTQIKRCNQEILNEMHELNIENPFDQLLTRERKSIFNNIFIKANAEETENFQYSDEQLIEEYLIFISKKYTEY